MSADSLNDIKIGNVTFEAGARTNWHYHPAGQILMVTDGTGYYKEKGAEKKILHKGDVIKCAPNVPHWHGASKNDMFVQIAVTAASKGETVWLQPVTDDEYNATK
jgi:quercetin dioxygenase-like cupin family protein